MSSLVSVYVVYDKSLKMYLSCGRLFSFIKDINKCRKYYSKANAKQSVTALITASFPAKIEGSTKKKFLRFKDLEIHEYFLSEEFIKHPIKCS